MPNIEYYFDQNRKMPYVYLYGMVLPFFILRTRCSIEINMDFDARENENFFNDKPNEEKITEMVEMMNVIYNHLENKYLRLDEIKDYRQNLVIAYAYQEIAEQIGPNNLSIESTQIDYEKIINKTKLYCAMAGIPMCNIEILHNSFK